MDSEQFGISVVPYFIDQNMQPHVLTVDELMTESCADLEYRLAHADQNLGSFEVLCPKLASFRPRY
jgi:hypothetical protein